jgi:hypothetical protein
LLLNLLSGWRAVGNCGLGLRIARRGNLNGWDITPPPPGLNLANSGHLTLINPRVFDSPSFAPPFNSRKNTSKGFNFFFLCHSPLVRQNPNPIASAPLLFLAIFIHFTPASALLSYPLSLSPFSQLVCFQFSGCLPFFLPPFS